MLNRYRYRPDEPVTGIKTELTPSCYLHNVSSTVSLRTLYFFIQNCIKRKTKPVAGLIIYEHESYYWETLPTHTHTRPQTHTHTHSLITLGSL